MGPDSNNLLGAERNESATRIKPVNPNLAVVVIDYVTVKHKPLASSAGGLNPEVMSARAEQFSAPFPLVANSPVTKPLTYRSSRLSPAQLVLP